MKHSLLIVDDNVSLLLSLKQIMAQSYDVEVCKTGVKALQKAMTESYDCVLLDVGLPDMSGMEVCRRLRQAGSGVPIIIVSGEGDQGRIAALLDAGADDYVIKPAHAVELQARVRTAIRRTHLPQSLGTRITIGGVTLDSPKHSVSRNGVKLGLRPKEFALLECLMHSAGKVVSRPILLRYAWDEASTVLNNVVDVHIKCLRDKLDHPFTVPLIKTVHGIGYKFDPPALKNKRKEMNHERTTTSRLN